MLEKSYTSKESLSYSVWRMPSSKHTAFVGYDIGECTERDRNGVSDNIDVVSAVANNMHIVFLISTDICIQIF